MKKSPFFTEGQLASINFYPVLRSGQSRPYLAYHKPNTGEFLTLRNPNKKNLAFMEKHKDHQAEIDAFYNDKKNAGKFYHCLAKFDKLKKAKPKKKIMKDIELIVRGDNIRYGRHDRLIVHAIWHGWTITTMVARSLDGCVYPFLFKSDNKVRKLQVLKPVKATSKNNQQKKAK